MKWVLIVIALIVMLGALVTVAGWLLPTTHVASVQAVYRQPADRVFSVIADVSAAPAWRTGLSRVDILSAPGEPLRWREHSSYGTLVFRQEEATPPSRIVGVIDDTSQGFGGRWIYELTPQVDGTLLRITEQGEVYNPFFRFMSRFVFGHHNTLEQYARDLGKHFNEEITPTRVVEASTP